jgi:hypothetical protein
MKSKLFFESFIPSNSDSSNDVMIPNKNTTNFGESSSSFDIDVMMKRISETESLLMNHRSRVDELKLQLRQIRRETIEICTNIKNNNNNNNNNHQDEDESEPEIFDNFPQMMNTCQIQDVFQNLHLEFSRQFVPSSTSNTSLLLRQVSQLMNWFSDVVCESHFEIWNQKLFQFEKRILICQSKISLLHHQQKENKNSSSPPIVLVRALCEKIKRRRQFRNLLMNFNQTKNNSRNLKSSLTQLVVAEIDKVTQRQEEENSKRRQVFSNWNIELAKLQLSNFSK